MLDLIKSFITDLLAPEPKHTIAICYMCKQRPVIESPTDEFYVCWPCYMARKFGKEIEE